MLFKEMVNRELLWHKEKICIMLETDDGEEVVYGPDRLEFLDCAGLPETIELYETIKEKEVSWYEVAYDRDENMPYIIYHLDK